MGAYLPVVGGQSGYGAGIYGTSANMDMAIYVYTYLSGLIERLWSTYKRRKSIAANRERQRYWAGILEGFHHKLREQEHAIGGFLGEVSLVSGSVYFVLAVFYMKLKQ